MGACSFELVIDATNNKQFRSLFFEAAEEDRYENGHDAYSGTIGQKNGYRMFDMVTPENLRALQERHEGGKWDDAHAVPVAEVKKKGRSKTRTRVMIARDQQEAKQAFIEKYGEGKKVIIKSVTKTREAVYKLVKKDTNTGWRVTYGWNGVFYGTKAQCEKLLKEKVLAGERNCNMVQQAQQYERVMKTLPKYEITAELYAEKPTGKVSHYVVWGWAAE